MDDGDLDRFLNRAEEAAPSLLHDLEGKGSGHIHLVLGTAELPDCRRFEFEMLKGGGGVVHPHPLSSSHNDERCIQRVGVATGEIIPQRVLF